MNRSILSHQQRLDHLFNKIGAVPDPNDQGEWAKYLCVLTAGFIEESLRVLLNEFVKNNSSLEIRRYLEVEVDAITNCKTKKIDSILTQFNLAWASTFQQELSNRSTFLDEVKDSVDSIVENRHKIAHGKSISIGFVTVRKYYGNVKKAVDALEGIIS